jgi:hypothetical protein
VLQRGRSDVSDSDIGKSKIGLCDEVRCYDYRSYGIILHREEDFAGVKACEGHSCTLVFADHTRGRARRWCSVAVCGNCAKQAARRERLKQPQTG